MFLFSLKELATDDNEAGLLKLRDLMSSQLDNAVELIKESLPKSSDDQYCVHTVLIQFLILFFLLKISN